MRIGAGSRFNRWRVGLVTMACALSSSALADEPSRPDFYIVFRDCQAIGVGPRGGQVKPLDSPESTLACWRQSRKVPCLFEGGETQKEIVFSVDAEVPPLLTLVQGVNAGDFLVIDTAQHTASLLTRTLLGGSGLVAKVCSGFFATADEVDALRAEETSSQKKIDHKSKAPPVKSSPSRE
ncbi:hypothetical protein KH5H1_27750 [Corallococcus caeni]|nr:hypothetical protein KH5H1_27750 [Corallococcus sp. KH5-1]